MDDKVLTQVVNKNGDRFLQVTVDGDNFYLPFKLIGGRWVAFLDISGQVKFIEACRKILAQKIISSGATYDTIINPVAKSNALSHAVAVNLIKDGKKDLSHTVVARKAKEGEKHKVDAKYHSVTTPQEQTMYLTDDDVEFVHGKNVMLMDDVYGRGGTTRGLKTLCDKAGANITAHAVLAIEEGTNAPANLLYLFELPVLDK